MNFQNESANQNSIDVPKFLHPYDRASETLFSVSLAVYVSILLEFKLVACFIPYS